MHSREGTAITRADGTTRTESLFGVQLWISADTGSAVYSLASAHTFSSLYQIALTFLSTRLRFNLSQLSVLNDFQLSSCPCNLHPSPPSLPARRLPCKDCLHPALQVSGFLMGSVHGKPWKEMGGQDPPYPSSLPRRSLKTSAQAGGLPFLFVYGSWKQSLQA